MWIFWTWFTTSMLPYLQWTWQLCPPVAFAGLSAATLFVGAVTICTCRCVNMYRQPQGRSAAAETDAENASQDAAPDETPDGLDVEVPKSPPNSTAARCQARRPRGKSTHNAGDEGDDATCQSSSPSDAQSASSLASNAMSPRSLRLMNRLKQLRRESSSEA